MATITIPKKLAQKGDLVVLPRKEYEALIGLRKTREFIPTAAQKKALIEAEANLKGKKEALKILREGMREYKIGKTKTLRTLRDLRYGN